MDIPPRLRHARYQKSTMVPWLKTGDLSKRQYGLTGNLALVITGPSVVVQVRIEPTFPAAAREDLSVSVQVPVGEQSLLSWFTDVRKRSTSWWHGVMARQGSGWRGWPPYRMWMMLPYARRLTPPFRPPRHMTLRLAYSLCHGTTGHLETLLMASQVPGFAPYPERIPPFWRWRRPFRDCCVQSWLVLPTIS